MRSTGGHDHANPGDSLADPDLFLAIDDLDLSTRALVDSVLAGNHRGAKIGPGAEFAQHRDYRQGDDLRLINWRLYGRTRRLFIKEVFAEAKMTVQLLLDASASMRTGEPVSKYRYCSRLAAALALIVLRGRDPVGLRIVGRSLLERLSARATLTQFVDILAALDKQCPGDHCDLEGALDEVLESSRQRGVIFVLSDFIGATNALHTKVAALRDFGHEVVLLQVLAPLEIALPASGDFEFTDPETGERVKTAVEPIRDRYAAAIEAWRHDLRAKSEALGAHWHSASSRDPMAPLLRELVSNLAQ